MNKKSFTLLEIIVSLVILSLTMAGLTNIFISGKRWLLHSRSRMTGGELGKFFLDDLQMLVRQDTWNNPANCLGAGSCPDKTAGTSEGLDKNYTAKYTITNGYPPPTNLKKVKVEITWPKD